MGREQKEVFRIKWVDIEKQTVDKLINRLGPLVSIGESRDIYVVLKFYHDKDFQCSYYSNKTLYCEFYRDFEQWFEIFHHILGMPFVEPTTQYLVGFDESGKGEVIGPIILIGVVFPATIYKKLLKYGIKDTKSESKVNWERVYKELTSIRELTIYMEKIFPSELLNYNTNTLMDLKYKALLKKVLHNLKSNDVRIVIDDYNAGKELKDYINRKVKPRGMEIILTPKADTKYLEVKIASLIAKGLREIELNNLKQNPRYIIEGRDFGTGNLGDERTRKWLNSWWKLHKKWPWFVKRSFKAIKNIEEEN